MTLTCMLIVFFQKKYMYNIASTNYSLSDPDELLSNHQSQLLDNAWMYGQKYSPYMTSR